MKIFDVVIQSLVFVLVLLAALWWLITDEADGSIIIGLLMLALGFVQLISGIVNTILIQRKPALFRKFYVGYWLAVIPYFVILAISIPFMRNGNEPFFLIWVFGIPWLIAIYYYVITIKQLLHKEAQDLTTPLQPMNPDGKILIPKNDG